MNKKIFLISILFIAMIGIVIFFLFFNNKTAKNIKIGNTSNSQEIVDRILNINSYEFKVEVEVNTNKNQNKYILKQQYKSPDEETQEVIEPSNIAGIKIIRKENLLRLENTNLNLSSIFENYQYLSDNCLDLTSFIKDYKQNKESKWEEKNNQIVMKTNNKEQEKTLNIDKNTGKPTKLEIRWTNKNESIYILYNEVTINS